MWRWRRGRTFLRSGRHRACYGFHPCFWTTVPGKTGSRVKSIKTQTLRSSLTYGVCLKHGFLTVNWLGMGDQIHLTFLGSLSFKLVCLRIDSRRIVACLFCPHGDFSSPDQGDYCQRSNAECRKPISFTLHVYTSSPFKVGCLVNVKRLGSSTIAR